MCVLGQEWKRQRKPIFYEILARQQYKMQTANFRPRTECTLQTRYKVETGNYNCLLSNTCHFVTCTVLLSHNYTFQRSSSMKIWPVSSYLLFLTREFKVMRIGSYPSLLTSSHHVWSLYMHAVINLNINTRDIQETVMVNGQSCSFCSQVQTYSLWASSS